MMPSLWDYLTRCGSQCRCVGVNHPQIGQLPNSCFTVSEPFLTSGYLPPSIPSRWGNVTRPHLWRRLEFADGCSDK